MSENWEKMESLFKKYQNQQPPQLPKPVGSGKPDHKTLVEMMDCPDCSKGFKDRILKITGMKECKGENCNHVSKEEEEYCPNCETYFE